MKYNKIKLICDPQHYTIYERFQDIEHALDGDELIYELWQNWGENRSDVQFRLKINKEFDVRESGQQQQNQQQQPQHTTKEKVA